MAMESDRKVSFSVGDKKGRSQCVDSTDFSVLSLALVFKNNDGSTGAFYRVSCDLSCDDDECKTI